jgi:hypothetical protein
MTPDQAKEQIAHKHLELWTRDQQPDWVYPAMQEYAKWYADQEVKKARERGSSDESLLYFMDWVIKNVWFDNDEYYIKGLGYTSYSKPELLEYFKEQNPHTFLSSPQPEIMRWPTKKEIYMAEPNSGVNDLTGNSYGDDAVRGFHQGLKFIKKYLYGTRKPNQ